MEWAARSGKENKKWAEKIDELEKKIAKQSKTMKRKCKEQAKDTAELLTILKEDIEKKMDFKFQEITKELEEASNFMLDLHSKNVLLTNQVNENIKGKNSMEQKLNSFGKENVSEDYFSHKKWFAQINERVSENSKSIQQIKNQGGSLMTSLKQVEKRLEDVCCQGLAEKEDLNKKIGHVASQVEEILTRISKIESTHFAIGFEACVDEDNNIYCQGREILACFTMIFLNLDNNFDIDTGMYTVPQDGLYLCALLIKISTSIKDEMYFCIYCKHKEWKGMEDEEEPIACCHNKVSGQTVCDVVTRKLKSGDKLYVKYEKEEGEDVHFDSYSHFTCVLLNHC